MPIDKEAVKSRIDLRDLVNETVNLDNPRAAEATGVCPFHGEKTASLKVTENLYHCFGCGAGGDCFTWVEKTRNVDFKEALRVLAERVGVASATTTTRQKSLNGRASLPPKSELPPNVIDPQIVADLHNNMPPERRAYFRDVRGLDDATIDAFQLGWDGKRYLIPVIVDGVVRDIRRRHDDANKRDAASKMLPWSTGNQTQLFNQDVLKGAGAADPVVICEGEFDAMVLTQYGWRTVTSTGGAQTFKREWIPLFDGIETIYAVFDLDSAGQAGAEKVARLLGKRCHIVTLPDELGEHGDISDYFIKFHHTAADFAELTAEAVALEEPDEPVKKPVKLHLALATEANLVEQQVTVRVLVAGKVNIPYLIPREVDYSCPSETCNNGGAWSMAFNDSSTVLLECCHEKKQMLDQIIRRAGGACGGCRRIKADIKSYARIEEALIVPITERLTAVQGEEFDESGLAYVQRTAYVLDDSLDVNRRYALTGRVHPDPKTQQGTFLITNVEPLQDNIDEFRVTDDLRGQLSVFQARNDSNIVQHVDGLLDDLTDHVTQIYGRNEALLATLLGYHSILQFPFESKIIRRGWLEVLLLGDSGQGKSRIVQTVMDACGMGTFASGETTRRTGLTYAVEQIGARWIVKWGKYPLADRRLLVLDELSEFPEKDLQEMTQARNDGVLNVDRAGVGSTYCRTRIIWLSNPRDGKTLGSFQNGVEALKTLFPTPADQRRVDLAVFLAADDIDIREINIARAAPGPQMITPEILKASILWAWSRRPEQVEIGEAAYLAILDEATRLADRFGGAADVPLVSPADQREKLARLAVAFAALVHSTNEKHERVIVLPIHVAFVARFLESVYAAENCRYDIYAQHTALQTHISEAEAAQIWTELRALDHGRQASLENGKNRDVAGEMVRLWKQHDSLQATDVADLLDLDRRTVASRFRVLQQHFLLRRSKGGMYKTAKFIEFMRAAPNTD